MIIKQLKKYSIFVIKVIILLELKLYKNIGIIYKNIILVIFKSDNRKYRNIDNILLKNFVIIKYYFFYIKYIIDYNI